MQVERDVIIRKRRSSRVLNYGIRRSSRHRHRYCRRRRHYSRLPSRRRWRRRRASYFSSSHHDRHNANNTGVDRIPIAHRNTWRRIFPRDRRRDRRAASDAVDSVPMPCRAILAMERRRPIFFVPSYCYSNCSLASLFLIRYCAGCRVCVEEGKNRSRSE